MKHRLPKRLYKDMCLLDFCKMKISFREATLTLQKPYSSARLRLLAVSGCVPHTVYILVGRHFPSKGGLVPFKLPKLKVAVLPSL